ncbi:MAG TPA: hypothetical protein DCS28_01975 [Candidatus Moranbacteria bacterium]|nr:hypothetical protein [Candidatus Moranbacteria bacterium]HAT74785.1 hypothetical protein [Candidatus Moranbacteria bacterium]
MSEIEFIPNKLSKFKAGLSSKIKKFLQKKVLVRIVFLALFIAASVFLFSLAKNNKQLIGTKSLLALSKISNLLPITKDERKEIEVLNKLVESFTRKDGQTKTFLLLLQNNMELRPGGGFLGQYAVIKIKDGAVISSYFEDANLLDQRIKAKIPTPYPFERMLQLKRWKFRDSNFSPDFPTNADKAKYFYRLSGRDSSDFDGVIAINSQVLNDILKIIGPIKVPGYVAEFNSDNAFLKLEEIVEKQYIMDPSIDTQNRKAIMKKMLPIIIDKLFSFGNISKLVDLAHQEFRAKNVMVNFTDESLQALAESAYWTGEMAEDWNGDYLMMVDANMGSLKTDYYIKREISYDIDLTTEKPLVNLNIIYKNTAPHGDWRTSDYHTYMRLYLPKGSQLLEREMVNNISSGEDFNKTYIGFMGHVLIGGETDARIKYELLADFPRDNYRLLIQKQSGVYEIPVKVHIKTKNGDFNQEQIMNSDLKFEIKEEAK